jgi:hypothetical protein
MLFVYNIKLTPPPYQTPKMATGMEATHPRLRPGSLACANH